MFAFTVFCAILAFASAQQYYKDPYNYYDNGFKTYKHGYGLGLGYGLGYYGVPVSDYRDIYKTYGIHDYARYSHAYDNAYQYKPEYYTNVKEYDHVKPLEHYTSDIHHYTPEADKLYAARPIYKQQFVVHPQVKYGVKSPVHKEFVQRDFYPREFGQNKFVQREYVPNQHKEYDHRDFVQKEFVQRDYGTKGYNYNPAFSSYFNIGDKDLTRTYVEPQIAHLSYKTIAQPHYVTPHVTSFLKTEPHYKTHVITEPQIAYKTVEPHVSTYVDPIVKGIEIPRIVTGLKTHEPEVKVSEYREIDHFTN